MIWLSALVFVGVLLWLSNLQVLSLARDWPLILIVLGVVNILNLFKKKKKASIINDLEKGKITVEEAEEKLKKTH
jgi:hypothetical protein